LATFQVWKTFPSRDCFLAVGAGAAAIATAGLRQASRRGYFLNRADRVLHILVIADLLLESLAFEAFRLFLPSGASEAESVRAFHASNNHFSCALVFAIIIGFHRWLALRKRNAAAQALSTVR